MNREALRQIAATTVQADPRCSKLSPSEIDFFVVRPVVAILSLGLIGSGWSLCLAVILTLLAIPILFFIQLILAVFRSAAALVRGAIEIGDILVDMVFPCRL